MMFKNKSPLGKQNLKNDWFVNQQLKYGPPSPLKQQPIQYDPFPHKTKRHHEHFSDKTLPAPPLPLPKHHSDPLNLECDQTLELYPLDPPPRRTHPEMDLLCQEELDPWQEQDTRSLRNYFQRFEAVLEKYMRKDMAKQQQIRELQRENMQLAQINKRQEEALRSFNYPRK